MTVAQHGDQIILIQTRGWGGWGVWGVWGVWGEGAVNDFGY
ncbi:hypothetical protein PCC8801_0469 [Rippkaea orientalis PCC 8801]|uniref:Uncharacterized protein n=1 Tax=Rippkaea orientalis (strain PCC 8801 / RF-1) TaxID=41431 RepID=B7JVJ4_RIPO1|nr:hypothetical protein PCC8801_0469 [Rippkaea orientalis PCC 8801]